MTRYQVPNIAIVSGGNSSEFIVSQRSGANIYKAIDKDRFSPWMVEIQNERWEVFKGEEKIADINRDDFSFEYEGATIHFDFAYITIHGTPGEDGILQAYFELIGLPYSGCDVHTSSLTFNKWFCNRYLKSFGIKMSSSVKLRKGQDKIDSTSLVEQLGLPLFVKPNSGGSSFGVSKVKSIDQLHEAVQKAWVESTDALVEAFVSGTEFTCGAVKLNGEIKVLPVTEVLPKNEFFDFEAKYTPGAALEITPARLPENLYKNCQELTKHIYELCECSGLVRVDFILHDNEFYFLEVNTTPGMTATSFIPQQIEAAGANLGDILSQIIEDKLKLSY